jgi:outer membrane receptor protein involved in Fe transport
MTSKKKLGWILLSSASLAAMGAMAPAAYAQDADEPSEEIVVTATGRTTAIQDVPIAVTAIGGETLEDAGVENLLDLQQLAPSLRIGSGQSTSLGTTVRIRALGTGGDNPGFESAVGFFIDGVFRARAGIAISDLPEVERIEVLRGPQGTLYGRNTSSGAISVTTAQPGFEPGAWIEANVGDLNYGALRAGFDLPLSDTFAFRFDGSLRARDGFMEDFDTGEDFNTQNRYSLRGQAVWDISDTATLRIIADVAETDEDCCAATILRYGSTQAILDDRYLIGNPYAPFLPSFGGSTLPNTANVVNSPDERLVSVSPARDYLERVQDGGVSAQLDWDIGGLNFTSITAYRGWGATRGQDIDFNSADLFYRDGLTADIENFTQEFRLQGEAGRLNWLVGAFYSAEDLNTTDRIRYGAQASDYADAVVFGNTLGTRELFDNTSALVDAGVFGGVDPVPSILGAINPLFNQTYLAPNSDGDGQQADNWTQEARDIALFTHNEFSVSDATTLTVGLRYSQSEKEYNANLNAVNPNCASMQGLEAGFGVFSGLNASANGGSASAQGLRTLLSILCAPQANPALNGAWTADRDEEAWSGVVSLRHEVTDDLMFYGSYARGYKAGGFNLDRSSFLGIFPGMTAAQARTGLLAIDPNSIGFEPETVDSYELGMRSTILNGTTFFNVTLFYSQLHDYQLNAFNGTAFITRNIPEAISQGVEIDILSRLTRNLTIQGGINYTDAFNDSTVAFSPSPADTIVEGTPLVQAPEWSLTGAITYELPINDDMMARFYLDARYDTEYQTQALGRNPISDMDDTLIVNGRIGLGSPQQNWSIELWGRNLTDELIYGGFNAPLQSGTVGAYTNEGQTYGVTVRARY